MSRSMVWNIQQSEKIKQKFRDTCVKNHGVEHPSLSESKKMKKWVFWTSQFAENDTNVKNLGVENPFQSEVRYFQAENEGHMGQESLGSSPTN